MKEELIAPCGMNCGICSSYLALSHKVKDKGLALPYCAGCRPRNKQCSLLKKRCTILGRGDVRYCFECADFPCENLLKLDKRYRKLYRMSMIENLEYLKECGMRLFLCRERERWKCPACGDTVCCHNGICFNCGLDMLVKRKKIYRWNDDEK
jgi:hypothetical protein